MARCQENTGFVCLNCNKHIEKVTNGRYRNHCPYCLHSLHVDVMPGDRANACHGLMVPIGLIYKAKKGWQIIHRCQKCGDRRANKIAVDTVQTDDCEKLALINLVCS